MCVYRARIFSTKRNKEKLTVEETLLKLQPENYKVDEKFHRTMQNVFLNFPDYSSVSALLFRLVLGKFDSTIFLLHYPMESIPSSVGSIGFPFFKFSSSTA